MNYYTPETSQRALSFLKKNVFISLSQEKELIQTSAQKEMSELDTLLFLFPENEEKISEIVAHIYHVSLAKKNELKNIFKAGKFFVHKNKNSLTLITHDPEYIIEYFNYMVPHTRVINKSTYDTFIEEKYPEIEETELKSAFSFHSSIIVNEVSQETKESITSLKEDSDASVALDWIFQEALSKNSSDIHIEVNNHEGGMEYQVRLRVDGMLITVLSSPNIETYSGILSQIKLRSGLKLDETRLPQDGRMTYTLYGKQHAFRVSTKPVVVNNAKQASDTQKEKIVIRKMPDVNNLKLQSLGFHSRNIELLKKAIDLPHGFNIVTGPTGSGKTTLLYALLKEIDATINNVSTIEDPVEAELTHVNQTQIHPEIGLTFSRVLRAELRQDPDIIMVGEMRDLETAEIAAEASLTGHLVFSTLHTKSSIASITRLINMGVAPYVVSSSLSFVIAQRLVRRLCTHCKVETNIKDLSKEYKSMLKHYPHPDLQTCIKDSYKSATVYEAKGCKECQDTGYKGRIAILEVCEITHDMKQAIVSKDCTDAILLELAQEQGFLTLELDGFLQVLQGNTSLSELKSTLDHDALS